MGIRIKKRELIPTIKKKFMNETGNDGYQREIDSIDTHKLVLVFCERYPNVDECNAYNFKHKESQYLGRG